MRRMLLIAGALSSPLYLAGDVCAGIVYPGYHSYTAQMVSELMARDAPTRTLIVWFFLPYNVLAFALAAGVWLSAARRVTKATAAALLGYAMCSSAGLLLAPMDLRDAGMTPGTLVHIGATALQGVFIALSLLLGAFTHGARFRAYSLVTLVVCLGFGAWAGAAAAVESVWIGLIERVDIYAWMLWLSILAISFWRGERER